MCLQAIACCSLQLSGKLLRCKANLCEHLVQYGPAWGGPNEHM
jgi:hypothetical protein